MLRRRFLRAWSPILAFAAFLVAASTLRADVVSTATTTLDLDRLHAAISRRDDVADTTLITYSAAFPEVGRLLVGSASCSGVLIAPNAVLTAGHCIVSGNPNAYQFTIGGNTYTGSATFLPSTWTNFDDSIGKGDDIAVIVLSANVTNVAPATLYDGADEVGHLGTDVGYGFAGTGSTGQGGGLGVRRAGDNQIDSLGSVFYSNVSDKILLADFDNPLGTSSAMGSPTPVPLESLITQGDSGGGQFATINGIRVLVGIHSFIDDFNNNEKLSDYGDIEGSTRVSQNLDFIRSVVPGVVVPEPGSLVLCGLGLALVGLRLVRRKG